MEIMEEGNLVDRVRILLQRDMQYYQEQQTVLRETMCVRMTGGRFDFPRHASFSAVKMVSWWEAEFIQAFRAHSGLSPVNKDDIPVEEDEPVKKTKPSEFILLVVETSAMLMSHLHLLIQESLDHADLTVLTSVLGAAALIRNSLWCYNKKAKGEIPAATSEKVHKCYKNFDELAEAVAERLLDLHNRLIALYIFMEADSCSWEKERPFFERQRGFFVIQMWWLYMQGTKTDLWNTVPPKMAQRVFSGMLNESLTILVTRFLDGRPSLARSMAFWNDGLNVLRCTARLALSVCVSGDEMIGRELKNLSIDARDIYHKCYHLLVCLLLRGAPLDVLFQVFRKGLEDLTISKPQSGPAAWLYVCAPTLFGSDHTKSKGYNQLDETQAAILELNVFKSQPQPNWTQMIRVLTMNEYALTRVLLGILVRQCANADFGPSVKAKPRASCSSEPDPKEDDDKCGGFLCAGNSCQRTLRITPVMGLHALVHVMTGTGYDPAKVLVPELKNDPKWSSYLDRQQVWNQTRPPWLNALLVFLEPVMEPIVETLLDAMKTGATIYQAMSVALGCFSELHICMPLGVLRAAHAMDDCIPAYCHPIGHSVILQMMCAALYSALLAVANKPEKAPSSEAATSSNGSDSSIALILTEALCSIDEDNKHTAQIEDLLSEVRESVNARTSVWMPENEETSEIIDYYLGQVGKTEVGRNSLDYVYEYIIRNSKHLLELLRPNGKKVPDSQISALNPLADTPLLYTMFHIGDEPFDQLLMNYKGFPWEMMFDIPLGVSTARVRGEVLARPEFANMLRLGQKDKETAELIKQIVTTGEILHR